MKFSNDSEVESEDLLNLTSMIDVVFTLLAFFVITMRVFGNERDMVVGGAGSPSMPGIQKNDIPEQITIVCTSTPDQRLAARIGNQRCNSTTEVTDKLNEINLPHTTVVVAASPDVSIEQVTSVVDSVMKSRMRTVSLREATAEEIRLASGGRS